VGAARSPGWCGRRFWQPPPLHVGPACKPLKSSPIHIPLPHDAHFSLLFSPRRSLAHSRPELSLPVGTVVVASIRSASFYGDSRPSLLPRHPLFPVTLVARCARPGAWSNDAQSSPRRAAQPSLAPPPSAVVVYSPRLGFPRACAAPTPTCVTRSGPTLASGARPRPSRSVPTPVRRPLPEPLHSPPSACGRPQRARPPRVRGAARPQRGVERPWRPSSPAARGQPICGELAETASLRA
jgi:hypothetical protein